MKLFEFFGNINHNPNQDKDLDSKTPGKEEEQQLADDVFWYILDDNDLHKKYFMPISKELKIKYADTKDDDSRDWKVWLPLVNAGCMKFWKEHKIKQHPKDAFHKEFRRDVCKRLEDHYHEEIAKDKE
jgi:hypothetical protein